MHTATSLTDPSKLESGAWFTPLPQYEFTLCHGADNSRFLQGQLSCNLQKLTLEQSLRGALCNLKGRVITDLRVISDEKGIWLLTQYGMREKLLVTLNRYSVFFKTTLEPVNDRLLAIGLGGPDLESVATGLEISLPTLPDHIFTLPGFKIIFLPQSTLNKFPRFLCVVDTTHNAAMALMQSLTERLALLPDSLWQLADIRDGVAHIRQDQSELFTPQLLNYDINGVVDFKKGCYTGQEIVARMHYKAEAKRRLYHARTNIGVQETETAERDANSLNQVLLVDGSIESLIMLNVSDALNNPEITGFS